MRKLLLFVFISFIVTTHFYIYNIGRINGELRYKRSIRMYLALKSAYKFGYGDCQAGRQNNWDGEN